MQHLSEELTDAVYHAALEPAAWNDVMRLMRASFPSSAQTFYFLDLGSRHVRPVCLTGVGARWVGSFDELYFAPDNPWIRLTRQLHRPGLVRTNERLDRFLGEDGALYRSAYYNEWMRPQGFRYTIGNTLRADGGVVANVTLFRSPDEATFSDGEVEAFEQLSRHMTRSLQIAVRLGTPESCAAGAAALAALPQPVGLVDAKRRLVYANEAMESLLRRRRGLAVRNGQLEAAEPGARERFAAYASGVTAGGEDAASCESSLALPCSEREAHLNVRLIPVSASAAGFLPPRPTYLLLATECGGRTALGCEDIRSLYGCTASEARLAHLVGQGHGLRQAAQAMGIGYETARGYLKIVFQKAGVHTQAQLVALLLGDLPASAHPKRPL